MTISDGSNRLQAKAEELGVRFITSEFQRVATLHGVHAAFGFTNAILEQYRYIRMCQELSKQDSR